MGIWRARQGLVQKWFLLLLLSVLYIIIINALHKRLTGRGLKYICVNCDTISYTNSSSISAGTSAIPSTHHHDTTASVQHSLEEAINMTNKTRSSYPSAMPNRSGSVYGHTVKNSSIPVPILIVAYQRTGSSFFGQIFNHHPGSFFAFEPLDGVFSHLYGTLQGWNVPSDITTHHNGSHRAMSSEERAAVTSTLSSLLTCRITELPTEVLLHTFWSDFPKQHLNTNFYSNCLKNMHINIRRCYMFLRRSCPPHYDADNIQMHICHDFLHSPNSEHISVANYEMCSKTMRSRAAPCIKQLQKVCLRSQLRATKVVRPAMEVVDDLLAAIPDLKVIHLVRDPRDVAVSRMLMQSAHSRIAEKLVIKVSPPWPPMKTKPKRQLMHIAPAVPLEAKIFCDDVLADLDFYNTLAAKYKTSFFRLRYEDFISSPLSYGERVYDFVQLAMPSELQMWLNSTVSTKSKWKWKTWDPAVIGYYFKQVQYRCRHFYQNLYPEL